MARAKRNDSASAVPAKPHTPHTRQAILICPVCGTLLGDEPVEAHLAGHTPTTGCQHCENNDKKWKIDWDWVNNPRSDVSIFYCSNCGRYAPVMSADAKNTPMLSLATDAEEIT